MADKTPEQLEQEKLAADAKAAADKAAEDKKAADEAAKAQKQAVKKTGIKVGDRVQYEGRTLNGEDATLEGEVTAVGDNGVDVTMPNGSAKTFDFDAVKKA